MGVDRSVEFKLCADSEGRGHHGTGEGFDAGIKFGVITFKPCVLVVDSTKDATG